MSLFSVVQIILTKIPLMISLKVWLPSLQFLRTGPVTLIFLSSEIHIDNYNTLRCDRNRHGGGVVYYIRNNLSYDVKSFFSPEVENVFFELLLPSTKPIVTGIIYWPPIQSEFLEIINNHFNKIDTINNEIYILGDFNIKLYLNNSYIFQKNSLLQSQSILSDIRKYYEFCTMFGLKWSSNTCHFNAVQPSSITC